MQSEVIDEAMAVGTDLGRAEREHAALYEISRVAPGNHQEDPCYGPIVKLKDLALAALDEQGPELEHALGRAIIDGAVVIYDLDDPPKWLKPILAYRDDDGSLAHATVDVTAPPKGPVSIHR